MKKIFENYDEAYSLYSNIVSGREPDRKNPSIFFTDKGDDGKWYTVEWQTK